MKKKTNNVLTEFFFIFHKSDVKTFLKQTVNECFYFTCQHDPCIFKRQAFNSFGEKFNETTKQEFIARGKENRGSNGTTQPLRGAIIEGEKFKPKAERICAIG